MDINSWMVPTQPQADPLPLDTGDWRSQLQPDQRQRIVNKIMDTLKKHLPFSGQDGLNELKKIAVRFEEKIYSAALNQPDYLRKISMKMLSLESKSQNTLTSSGLLNPTGSDNYLLDTAPSVQSQVHGQMQSLPVSMANNQSQMRQTLLSQNIQNNIISSGVQSSGGLTTALPSSSLNQAQLSNYASHNATVPNVAVISQNAPGNAGGQGAMSNTFTSSQRPMQVRQLGQQAAPQHLYQQQLQQQLLKQKLQQGNVSNSLLQSNMQQQQQQLQQQQNMLHQSHLQASQQSFTQTSTSMQPPSMQSAQFSGGLQQNPQQPLHQISQSVLQQQQQTGRQQLQASLLHQQQASGAPQSIQQRPQHLIAQQVMDHLPNSTNIQHQLLGQQNNVHDMQQQQRLLGQQSISNLQQPQQLLSQQNQLSNIQQQLVVPSGISKMQSNQHGHMLNQSKLPPHQLAQQSASALLPSQGQQAQSQQQLMSHIPTHSSQLQQLGFQQQSSILQRDAQQRHAQSGVMFQQQNFVDHQRQIFQSQKVPPDVLAGSFECSAESGQVCGSDWQEETYQKIKTMKEMYLSDLSEMYQKISAKLQMQDSLPQQAKSSQTDKLKIYKNMLEHLISFLQMQKSSITAGHREKVLQYEKQIVAFLNTNKPRRPFNSLQQAQIPSHLNPGLAQSPQSQITQLQQSDSQVNPQIQSVNFQGSLGPMQQNFSALQQGSSSSAVTNGQLSTMTTLQSNSNLDPGQRNSGSLQHIALGSIPQGSAGAGQQGNLNTMSAQSGVNMLQPGTAIQGNSNVFQQHQKQQQEILQAQQMKQQLQQRQMQQLIQKQQMLQQQFHQQNRQQQSAQLQSHQMSQISNDSGDFKLRQGFGIKAGVVPQNSVSIQRPGCHSQQVKSGGPFPITSSQLLQSIPPHISQHSSPQVDLSSLTKSTPLSQPSSSPLVAPSPSTPLAPSPIPGESEKITSGVSSFQNTGNRGQNTSGATTVLAHSLPIGTLGISASPLLTHLANAQGNQANTTAAVPGKVHVSELPFDRLMNAIKKLSPSALSASVRDIGSVVCMMDKVAGSAPGNGSRAAAGEDLVAMTKCRLQAKSIISEDGAAATKKMKRHTSAMPLNDAAPDSGINDCFRDLNFLGSSELVSTPTSRTKRPKAQVDHALLEEVEDINRRLIDTSLELRDEDVVHAGADGTECEGTIVKCLYIAVALSPSLKSHYTESLELAIQPLSLLVPNNYPTCSPFLLDDVPVEPIEVGDLSGRAKSRFNASVRGLSQPMSLWDIAAAWDACTRHVMAEYAEQSGGGSFSSTYGSWEDCVGAA